MSLLDPTKRPMISLGLDGMAEAFEEQSGVPDIETLGFDDRMAMLLDRETTQRQERSYQARLRQAQLRLRPTIEEVSCEAGRGLTQTALTHLATGDWIHRGIHLIVSGKTGCGKTFLAGALAHQACRQWHSVLYRRAHDLTAQFSQARANGRLERWQRKLAKCQLLVIDDWGLSQFTVEGRRDWLDLVERRDGRKSILIASQIPSEHWHEVIGEPTIADSIVDRITNNAFRVNLMGPSRRQAQAPPSLEEAAIEKSNHR